MENSDHSGLTQHMSAGGAWALAVGSIIGWGCFIQGAQWTRQAGGPLPLVVGFLLGGALMIVIGLSYAYLIPRINVAGGEFAYTYYSFGRLAAFVCGWMMLLGYVTLAAMNATAIPVLFTFILPDTFNFGYLYTIAGYNVYLGEVLVSVFFLLLFAVLNIIGVKKTGSMQLIMAVLLCAAVAAAVIGTVLSGKGSLSNLQPASGVGKSFFSGIISILVVSPYCFVGFDTIPQAAEEYSFSPKACKKLIVTALLIGSFIYIAMAVITDFVMPWQDLFSLKDSNGSPVKWLTGAMLERSMGRAGTAAVSVAVLMAVFTGINGFYLAASRLLYSMGRARMLPEAFGRVNRRTHTPVTGILFIMGVCMICPFFGRNVLGWVIDMCSVGTAIGYFFTCFSAYRMIKAGRARWGAARAVGQHGSDKGEDSGKDKDSDTDSLHPLTAIFGAVIALVILALLLLPFSPAQMSVQSFAALGVWIFVGFVFLVFKYKEIKAVPKDEMDRLILKKAGSR